ncbi:MAG TPA: hypothetical protein DCP92_01545, partial [Nitrospiraceae bacterium]|nr:hypothetical protein [Nitrospiraceae bacterium]
MAGKSLATIKKEEWKSEWEKDVESLYRKVLKRNPGFSFREKQLDMICDMVRNFMQGEVGLKESPTGSGKTLVTLFAAAFFCMRHKERVVIATPRKDLQQEYIETFKRLFRFGEFKGVSISLLKGKTNYISKVKLATEIMDCEDEELRDKLGDFQKKVAVSDGDIELLRDDFEMINTDKFTIDDFALTRGETGPEDEHYYRLAVKRASAATIVISNHVHLLAYAWRKSRSLETPFSLDYMMVDEAHMLTYSAFSFLSEKIAAFHVVDCVKDYYKQLMRSKKEFRGKKALLELVRESSETLRSLSGGLIKALEPYQQKGIFHVREYGKTHVSRKDLQKVGGLLNTFSKEVSRIITTSEKYDLSLRSKRALSVIEDLNIGINNFLYGFEGLKPLEEAHHEVSPTRDSFYVITMSPVQKQPSFVRVKPEVSGWLYNFLWKEMKSAIMLSGTLADAYSKDIEG